jgi:tetrahydromethanopterin S-methyltransferase subunit G
VRFGGDDQEIGEAVEAAYTEPVKGVRVAKIIGRTIGLVVVVGFWLCILMAAAAVLAATWWLDRRVGDFLSH